MNIAIISTAAALMTCASLAAQTPAPGSSPSPTYPAPAAASRPSSGNDKINVTGCVESSGATAFKLTKVADASKSAAGDASKPESTGAPRSDSMGPKDPEALLDQYTLTADPSINLSQHVNHKVTVSGTVSKTAASSSPSVSSPSPNPQAGNAAGGVDSPGAAALKVTSLKMVASSCQ